MTGVNPQSGPKLEPFLVGFCGVLGILGCIAPTLTMTWASITTDHQFLADTISDLGRGPNRFIMDTGFYIYAASLLALALAAAQVHSGSKWWSIVVLSFTFLALEIVAIGLWDAFGRTANSEGTSVHTKLTYGLGPLYVVGPVLMAREMWNDQRKSAIMFVVSAILWIIFATAFKLAPDWIDGGLEKIAIAVTLLWTIPFGYLMLQRARAEAS